MQQAEDIAVAILAWLAQEPEQLGRFLALTGTDPTSLRQAVNDRGFLAGIVDFLMGHEPTLMEFCRFSGVAPDAVVKAHAILSGQTSQQDF